MSGGYFDYHQYHIDDIADSIKKEIELSGTKLKEEDLFADKEYYKTYPEEMYYEKYSEEVIKIFKKAIKILREAAVYAQRIDWFLSGDDGEESFVKRLKEDLDKIKKT